MQTKICTKCGVEKPLKMFCKHKGCYLGVNSVCKICSNKHGRKWRKENPEKQKQATREWRKENPERCRELNKKWREANPAKTQKQKSKWCRKKRKVEPKFRLNDSMSTAINKALRGNKNGQRWELLVGFTLKQLRKHLEKQFTEGMAWDNYGRNGWHVDHEVPKSAFNFTKPEHRDFKRCWALKNLQPMWESENISKSNKITKHFQPSLLV